MRRTNSSNAKDGDRSTLPKPAPTLPGIDSITPEYTRTVHHDGNRYFATAEMAGIFRAQADRTVSRGETELVPLLHSRGVELLLVSPQTVFAVVTIEVGRP